MLKMIQGTYRGLAPHGAIGRLCNELDGVIRVLEDVSVYSK